MHDGKDDDNDDDFPIDDSNDDAYLPPSK